MTQDGPADTGQQNSKRNPPLVTPIAKAHHSQEQLESHEYSGIEDLAAANGVDRTYVGRILRLTSLAREIVEVVLTGGEPGGINLRRLQNQVPLLWSI